MTQDSHLQKSIPRQAAARSAQRELAETMTIGQIWDLVLAPPEQPLTCGSLSRFLTPLNPGVLTCQWRQSWYLPEGEAWGAHEVMQGKCLACSSLTSVLRLP